LATYEQDDDGQAAEPRVSDAQMHIIRDILISLGLEKKEKKFLEFLGVETLEQLPAKDYPKAIAALEAKKAKVQK